MGEFVLTPMASQKPSFLAPPAPYELRHLRRALSRLELTHATTSPVIANLKRDVVNRIRELEAHLRSTELPPKTIDTTHLDKANLYGAQAPGVMPPRRS